MADLEIIFEDKRIMPDGPPAIPYEERDGIKFAQRDLALAIARESAKKWAPLMERLAK